MQPIKNDRGGKYLQVIIVEFFSEVYWELIPELRCDAPCHGR